jgi:hypothetical protein
VSKWGALFVKQSWTRKNIGERLSTHETTFGSRQSLVIAYSPDGRGEEILGGPQSTIGWTISIILVDMSRLAIPLAQPQGQITR